MRNVSAAEAHVYKCAYLPMYTYRYHLEQEEEEEEEVCEEEDDEDDGGRSSPTRRDDHQTKKEGEGGGEGEGGMEVAQMIQGVCCLLPQDALEHMISYLITPIIPMPPPCSSQP